MSIDSGSESATLDAELARRLTCWQPDEVGTLMFVVDAGRVLLIHKKRGHGAGKINAPGGKIELAETAAECAVRETYEEVGIRVTAPRLMGTFKFVDRVASSGLATRSLPRLTRDNRWQHRKPILNGLRSSVFRFPGCGTMTDSGCRKFWPVEW